MEKVVALTDRARNEPRDLYDVWYPEDHVDLTRLMPEIDSKLEFRGRVRDTMGEEFERGALQEALSARLGPQIAVLPPFEDVFRAVRRAMLAAGLLER